MYEHALQRAVDDSQIRNLLASLAIISDLGDLDEWGQLFTEDAVYTASGGMAWEGREAIVESGRERRERGTHGPGSTNRHLSGAPLIRFTGPDTAEAQSYLCMFKDLPDGGDHQGMPTTSPTLLVVGYYLDSLRRTDDGWKVSKRALLTSSHSKAFREMLATFNS